MSDAKTKPTDASVADFINAVENKRRREDALILADLFKQTSGYDPVMWGESIIGYGQYRYKYKSGREGEWMLTGFSPRKAHQVIYLMGCYVDDGFDEQDLLFSKLGKHKMGASCLYINKLSDIDISVLEELIKRSCALMRDKYH
ncbi:MAG: DUF1801 domain-containing protein [Lentilitoribacter sp.]